MPKRMTMRLKNTTRNVMGTLRRLRRKRKCIDRVCEPTANSFPRHSVREVKCDTGGGGEGFVEPGKQRSPYSNGTNDLQNVPPGLEETTPFPPKRSSSLFTPGGASTLTLRHSKSSRECSSTLLNPKRISIATSSFWLDHPDMEKFTNTLDFGHETMKTHSVWGTSEQGSGRAEPVDIWGDPPAVKKGVLLQQREKLWSRWKERYIILTRDYLNCFRRSASIHRSGVTLSEMGSFIFKLRLADVEEVRWENRRSGSLVALVLTQEPRILLRVPNDNTEALHQWYTLLQECIYMSKERRQALRNNHTSTYGKTYSTTKSNPLNDSCDLSANCKESMPSPHSSSDEVGTDEGKEITNNNRVDDSSQSRQNASRTTGKYSTTNSSNVITKSNGTHRNSSTRKYSPVVVGDHDDDDDYDDYLVKVDEAGNAKGLGGGSSSGGGTSSSDVDEYVPITRRRTTSRGNGFVSSGGGLLARSTSSNLTLNDFIRNPWKGTRTPEGEGSSLEEIAQRTNETSSPSSPHQARRLSSGYAIPVDGLLRQNHQKTGGNKRPESWSMAPVAGQTNLFYRTPTIVPSQWKNKRDLPLARNGGAPFGRSTMIVCPSRLSAEVTYIRRM